MLNSQRLRSCLVWFAIVTVFIFMCMFCAGLGSIRAYLRDMQRAADLPAAQEAMNGLVQTVITHNPDTLLQQWGDGMVSLIPRGNINGGCIKDSTELVYAADRPLSVVANDYAALFAVTANPRIINDEEWFIVEISAKSELVLLPINKINPWLPSDRPPYPNQCMSAYACYKINVGFGDPARASCSG